jgi:hypothetical protein
MANPRGTLSQIQPSQKYSWKNACIEKNGQNVILNLYILPVSDIF